MKRKNLPNAIWGSNDAPYRCESCGKEEAVTFVSMKYFPPGKPNLFYVCGRCYVDTVLEALARNAISTHRDAFLRGEDIIIDPYEGILREQDRKRQTWEN